MKIAEYLEKNIDLIDNDLNGFFINAYTDGINDTDLSTIIEYLDAAEIEHKKYREMALHYILTRQFEDYQGDNDFLDSWIRYNLINYLGFTFEEIFTYIIENRNEFISEYIDIAQNAAGIWRVRLS